MFSVVCCCFISPSFVFRSAVFLTATLSFLLSAGFIAAALSWTLEFFRDFLIVVRLTLFLSVLNCLVISGTVLLGSLNEMSLMYR